MSFRTAYYSLGSPKPQTAQPLHRDYTPEQWQRIMQNYYAMQQRKK